MQIKETHIVPAISEKIRLQEYAVSIFTSLPTKSSLKKALKKELILLNGQPAKTSDWIIQGQKIELLEIQKRVNRIFNLKLEVIFEDEFLAIINKPSGIPTSGNYFKTIENSLAFNLKESSTEDALASPMPVHRLDNPTSGLLLIAKSKSAQVYLNRLFEEKKIKKSYTALVIGSISSSMILKNPVQNKTAETQIEVLQNFQLKNQVFSLVKVYPKTGRTHQIRIHLAENGLPIVGDQLYGRTSEIIKISGLFLAATSLEFLHPETKETIITELPLPQKFRQIIEFAKKT